MDTLSKRWHQIPLFARIMVGLALGVCIGLILGKQAGFLELPSKLLLRILSALASPLILLAVVQAIMHVQLPKYAGWKLFGLLLLNTLVAVLIGLGVANVLQPGKWNGEKVKELAAKEKEKEVKPPPTPFEQFLENIPKSVLGPLADDGKVISVILLAVAFGIALRRIKDHPLNNVGDLVEVALRSHIVILHWIIELIPFAVLGIVASTVGKKGFGDFIALSGFIVAVILALILQTCYYLVRIYFGCWASPRHVLVSMRDALVMAFSTASSTATMPVTFACLREKVGLKEQSASLGSLVGANFNNDGTALYEAMAALFISQLIGQDLSLFQQLQVVGLSIVASVGAAGIPEAGLVTMTLVLQAVHLPTSYITLLFSVDWFLDRCRTTVNVLGDVNVSCMLEGHDREKVHQEPAAAELQELVGKGGEEG